MILAVDIGNTNIKMGAWDHERLVFVSRLQTVNGCTQDEYAVKLLDLLRLNECNPSQFDGAIISSVVPQLSPVLKDAVRQVIQTKRIYVVGPGLKTGLNIKIDNPATLGSDMACAAVAAMAQYPVPCIIISLGTATAIFAIDGDGGYLGGSVSPGIMISLEALASRTAQLPHISLEDPGRVIGPNTIEAMKSGAVYGSACMLDGMIARMREELGGTAHVVACGGLAPFVVGHCREEILINDNLVLEGLRIIYQKNTK